MTVTDHASRYLLLCEAHESTRENPVIWAFEYLFAERGLPDAVRSDNGLPFASPNGLFNLSYRPAFYLTFGIQGNAQSEVMRPASATSWLQAWLSTLSGRVQSAMAS